MSPLPFVLNKTMWSLQSETSKRQYLDRNKLTLVSTKVKEDHLRWYMHHRGKVTPEEATVYLEASVDRDAMLLYYYLGANPIAAMRNVLQSQLNLRDRVTTIRRLFRTFENVVDKKVAILTLFATSDQVLFREISYLLKIPPLLLDDITIACVKNKYPLHSIRFLADQGANPSKVKQRVLVTQEIENALCPMMDTSSD